LVKIVPTSNTGLIQALMYGPPKTGKTTTCTALPWDLPPFDGKAIYVAWEVGSESLSPVLLPNREHLIIVKPETRKNARGESTFDPHSEAMEIATHDWRKETGAKTIIWDSLTATAADLLPAYANSGAFSSGSSGDKHITVGDKAKGSYMAIPMPGDYGMVHLAVDRLLKLLLLQDMNIIVIAHANYTSPEGGTPETLVGGPATVGTAGIPKIAGLFENLFRTEVKPGRSMPGSAPTPAQFKIITVPKGIWLGGMRMPGPNTMPEITVGADPSAFWRMVVEAQSGKPTSALA
jgi:hypothetical protein